ncbi:DUF6518 family protein [Streptomyces sp. NPDC046928]|uniref:DUF6518 family protein n=1 Tax=Streptomyces sp. NPDC046928 TaxID=3155021 RepID=UPI0033E0F2FF
MASRRTRGSLVILSALGGLLLGVLTNLAQGWLPGAWNQIANSGAVWCVVAFVTGALVARRGSVWLAVFCGLGAEVGLVVGYYGYAELGRDGMGRLFFPLVWLFMACIAGPFFGAAGHWWLRGRTTRLRVVGLACVAGVFGMEALLFGWYLHYTTQAWACFGISVLAPLLARSNRERALVLAVAAAFSFLAYGVVVLPLQALSG